MTDAELEAATLEISAVLWKSAVGADKDLALRGTLAARRIMQLDPSIALLVRLPFNRCLACGRGSR